MSSEHVHAAVVTGRRRIEIVGRPKQPLGPDEVRIEVEQCGISRADLRLWQNGPDGSKPAQLGREIAGTIVELGPEAAARRGLLVAAWMPDAGGLATSVTVKASHCVPVVERWWPFAVQPLGHVVSIAGAAGGSPGAHIVVIGGDFMALLMVMLIRATAGPRSLILASPRPERRDLASRVGATHVVAPDDLPRLVGDVTGGRGADIVHECTGDQQAFTRGAAVVRKGGHLVLAGPTDDAYIYRPDTGNARRVNPDEHQVVPGMAKAVELLDSGLIRPGLLPIATYPLSHVADAFHAAAGGSGKVVVTPMT